MSTESSAIQSLNKVNEFVRQHRLFSPGDRVVVGCSAGADSTCLLHILMVGLQHLRLNCMAVYVDHGLRPDTRHEQELVRCLATQLGARFTVVEVDVAGHVDREGGSVLDAARRLRYSALNSQALAMDARSVAVGHTLTDQAETVLLQLLRGAGSTGLAAMVARNGKVVRPLLPIEREDTEAYCRYHQLEWFDDPSNENRRYTRSRIRHDLLPHLKRYNGRIVHGLSRTAEILRAEDELLDMMAQKEFTRLTKHTPSGIDMDVGGVRSLPLALKRRVLRLGTLRAGEGPGAVTFEHVEALVALVDASVGTGRIEIPGGIVVTREYDRLLVLRVTGGAKHPAPDRSTGVGDNSIPLDVGDQAKVPWADLWIKADVIEVNPGTDVRTLIVQKDDIAVLDWDAVELPLFIRTRRAGDRLRPLGMGGEKKLKDLMIDKKIARRLRDTIPLVCDNAGIIWVAGHTVVDRVKVTEHTRRLLRLQVVRKSGDTP